MNSRQTIITALLAQLSTIRVSAGYNTDLGANIEEWKGYPTGTDDMPCLIVRDVEDKVESGYAVHDHELEIEIVIVNSGATIPAVMRTMIADVYDCLGANLTLGSLAYTIEYNGDTMELLHEEQRIMQSTITISVKYKTASFDSDKIYNV